VVNGYTPEHGVIGEGPLYIAPDCTTVLTADQLNAITSEILAAVDRLGFAYNTDRITNLGDALVAVLANVADETVARSGDTMTGPLLLTGDPTEDLEAATKRYVDAEVTAVGERLTTSFRNADSGLQTQINGKVNRAGDTMGGPLLLASDPTMPLQAATKAYVDANIGSGGGDGGGGGIGDAPFDGHTYGRQNQAWSRVLPIAGGSLTGMLSLAGAPEGDMQAANKAYVDQVAGQGAFPSGTQMLFCQASAPVGWTQNVSFNDRVLRVVNTQGGGYGGSTQFSSITTQTATGYHTLQTGEIPAGIPSGGTNRIVVFPNGVSVDYYPTAPGWSYKPAYAGTGDNFPHAGNNGIGQTNNGQGTNNLYVYSESGSGAHRHPINLDMQYVDVIVARKD
jgi:hypothetical protein